MTYSVRAGDVCQSGRNLRQEYCRGAMSAQVHIAILDQETTGFPYRMLSKFDDILACCAFYLRSIPLNLPWPSLAISRVVDVGWMLDNYMHCFTQELGVNLEIPTT